MDTPIFDALLAERAGLFRYFERLHQVREDAYRVYGAGDFRLFDVGVW